MLTEKNYCDYDTCVALRELGYNYPQRLVPDYFGVFNKPQYDEKIHLYDAQKWLREEFGMLVDSIVFADNSIDADGEVADRWIYYSYAILNTSTTKFIRDYDDSGEYDTYEEALSEGVRASIKILQNETIHE